MGLTTPRDPRGSTMSDSAADRNLLFGLLACRTA